MHNLPPGLNRVNLAPQGRTGLHTYLTVTRTLFICRFHHAVIHTALLRNGRQMSCSLLRFNNSTVTRFFRQIHVAQRITRSATNREIAGSNPVMDKNSFVDSDIN